MHIPCLGFLRGSFLLIALALTAASCSSSSRPQLFPVRGKVVVNDKAAEGVLLTFLPASEKDPTPLRPLAISSEDGTFTVKTDEEEGAPAGEYVVTMVWKQDAPPPNAKKGKAISMKMGSEQIDKLGGKYVDRKKGFKVKIEKGPNELKPFEVK